MKLRMAVSIGVTLGLLVLAAGEAQAFCVYNKITKPRRTQQFPKLDTIAASIIGGGSYKNDLDLGKSGCCHWSNRGCNNAGGQRSNLRMRIEIIDQYQRNFFGAIVAKWSTLCEVNVQAGGWIDVVREWKVTRTPQRPPRPDKVKRELVTLCKAHNP